MHTFLIGSEERHPQRGPAPEPEDEGCHEPGPEPLWNESWYFDVVSEDRRIGAYHRIGRLPNRGECLLSSCIVRPGEPALMLVARAPLPAAADPTQAVATERVRAEQHCEEPLQRFSVSVEGTAEAHADHSAPLRGEAGEPVALGLELSWETDGMPYLWHRATRYEVPCRVGGTVRVGSESFEIAGPGQRDHSWGARDWWASDWMWCGLHLDDGAHLHAVSVPTHPDFAVGYVQRGGELVEVSRARSSEEVRDDGLVGAARIALEPGGIELEVEPLAFGALRLTSADGRVSHFPRAMCALRAADGREGVGWVEWNRNQR